MELRPLRASRRATSRGRAPSKRRFRLGTMNPSLFGEYLRNQAPEHSNGACWRKITTRATKRFSNFLLRAEKSKQRDPMNPRLWSAPSSFPKSGASEDTSRRALDIKRISSLHFDICMPEHS